MPLERTHVGIVPGTTQIVRAGAAAGGLTVSSSNASVDARYDASANAVVLSGRVPGNATVTVTGQGGAAASIDVLVAPAAGSVPADATVELAGTVSPQFASARIEGAIGRRAALQPGTALDVAGITIANPLQPGTELEGVARVHLDGGGRFVDVDGTTNVQLRVEPLDRLVPALLLYSDDPEKVPSGDAGVLYRGRIEPGRPARLYVYHVAEGPDTRLFLALRPESGSARVQVLGYAAGPADAYGYVGHVATLQYLLERSTQESAIVTASGSEPYVRELGYRAPAANDLVAAIFDLRVLEGGPVDVEVIAAGGATDPMQLFGAATLPGDGHGRSGVFSLADVSPLALAYATGGPEPAPFVVGDAELANLVPGGRPLGGDYGVVRPVALQLSNPDALPQSVYLYETPHGGSATTTMWFDGDAQPTQVGCVRAPEKRYLVKQFDLAPHESRAVAGSYMTDGTSSFPLAFGLTSAPPAPAPDPAGPDGCNSRN